VPSLVAICRGKAGLKGPRSDMSPSPPIPHVRSTSPKVTKPTAPAPPKPDTFPAGAILTSFDSWVSNTARKFGVPDEQIRGLVHMDTEPRRGD
jgi:hypothetical protein